MKKSFTLLMIVGIFMVPFTIKAQTDITPAKYVFADQPLGPYSMDKQYNLSSANNNDPDLYDFWNEGFITLANHEQLITSLEFNDETQQGTIINSMFQIYDMGGEVGKVLMMKENGSNFEYGTPGLPGYIPTYLSVQWFGPIVNHPTVQQYVDAGDDVATATAKATIRFRIVFHIHQNEFLPEVPRYFLLQGYNELRVNNGNGKAFHGYHFTDTETVDGVYDPNKWIATEYDHVANDDSEAPLSFSLAMHSLQNSTFLIKEISFTANPTGDPIETEVLTMSWGDPTAISEVEKQTGFNGYAKNGRLYLENVKHGSNVAVYSISGALVESFKAGESTLSHPLPDGLYIVRVGDETKKVIVN